MERAAKRAFWVLNAFFLVAAAYLTAGSINAVVAQKLRVLPAVAPGPIRPKPPDRRPEVHKDNQIIVTLNLFGSAMAVSIPGPQNPAVTEDSAAIPPTPLQALLVGTVVATDPGWSFALITDRPKAETGPYRIGDFLMGAATISGIFPDQVQIEREGRTEILAFEPRTSNGRTKATTAVQPGSAVSGVRKVSEGSFIVDHKVIEDLSLDPNRLALLARVAPSSGGFKVFAIRPDSLVSAFGFQNDDVIQKVNGFPTTSIDKILEILQQIKKAKDIEIEVQRQGRSQKLVYQIQ